MTTLSDTQIKEIFGPSLPYWIDYPIQSFEDEYERCEKFITSSYWSDCASVNVGELCGLSSLPQKNGEQHEVTWRQFLSGQGDAKDPDGDRINLNLQWYKKHPEYYSICEKRENSIYFTKINNKLFVNLDGRNRAVIAKFHAYQHPCPYLHNVTLVEYQIDNAFMKLYEHFIKQLNILKECGIISSYIAYMAKGSPFFRDDAPGWRRDYYKLNATCRLYVDSRIERLSKESFRFQEKYKDKYLSFDYIGLRDFIFEADEAIYSI